MTEKTLLAHARNLSPRAPGESKTTHLSRLRREKICELLSQSNEILNDMMKLPYEGKIKMTEQQISHAIRLEAPKHGVVLMRNNVGCLKDRRGHHIFYGLGVGTSDLIGWIKAPRGHLPVYATFVAIEVKGPRGRVTKAQQKFLDLVNRSGGIAGVCRSVEDFLHLIQR